MKKKLFWCFILICMLISLASCGGQEKVDSEKNADVKKETVLQDNKQDDTEKEPVPQEKPLTNEVKEETAKDVTPEELIKKLDAAVSDGGEYKEDVIRLCNAIVLKDAETFAQFTGGKAEYYDFLSKVEIASYKITPFEVSPEVIESHIYHGDYPMASDNYLVEFDVISSDCEEFTVGKCIYYAGFEMNPISGNILSVFVPAQKAYENMYNWCVVPLEEDFAKEFAALYPIQSPLYDGRNYPDSFDFSIHPHLITHLMANDNEYGEPPYTFEEVNRYITEHFDGNKGLTLAEMSSDDWTPSLYDDDYEEGRIYGCSYAHGGTSVVSDFPEIVKDGSRTTLSLDIFADYSMVAKAYTLVFHFKETEGGCDCLTMIELHGNTGREPAILSV